jgi:hypothetical protein
MAIPVDPEGMFEATTADGTVVGEGRVDAGAVEFRYGDMVEGERPYVLILPTPEFEQAWALLPQARVLTLRAAGG